MSGKEVVSRRPVSDASNQQLFLVRFLGVGRTKVGEIGVLEDSISLACADLARHTPHCGKFDSLW